MSIAFTDPYIRNIKIKGRYTDSATQGLNIQVKANGAKYWTFRYLYQGKRHDLGLGTYPAISLKDARARATAARNQIKLRLMKLSSVLGKVKHDLAQF